MTFMCRLSCYCHFYVSAVLKDPCDVWLRIGLQRYGFVAWFSQFLFISINQLTVWILCGLVQFWLNVLCALQKTCRSYRNWFGKESWLNSRELESVSPISWQDRKKFLCEILESIDQMLIVWVRWIKGLTRCKAESSVVWKEIGLFASFIFLRYR